MLSGDQKLVERCLEGDDTAWETVIRSYGKSIYNLSYRFSNRKEDAEDLTQEILLRVYRNLKSYRSEAGSLKNWILRVARNLIIDHYRRQRRLPPSAGDEELETMNIRDETAPNPHQAFERGEAARFLMDGIQSLSFELKEAVLLRDLEGMAYHEMADCLNVPEGTVKSRINRGRVELTKLLIKRRTMTESQE
ncbi:MAG: sigma-70 family RNA polymerase sigma factor [Acidobacteria bacterium]|nr:sigma-70 family RNA polymerase sigma factor [Acidobacteriota bacterium]